MITNPQFFIGVVEDIHDPSRLNRVRARIFGKHTEDITLLPTAELPWYNVVMPVTSASTSGVGQTLGLVQGSWVFGTFIDGPNEQDALILGSLPGESTKPSQDGEGFKDPNAVYPKASGSDTSQSAANPNSSVYKNRVAQRVVDIPIATQPQLSTLSDEDKPEDKGVSLRSFCTNNNAAYVAAEHTYGDYSYNGHAKKDEAYRNDMTNFGILMEIKNIDKPFDWSREAVKKLQKDGKGTYYSPSHRVPSKTSEGDYVKTEVVDSMDTLYQALGEYAFYIEDFIEDMKEVFPTLGDDWGIYMPEVKYLSPEPLVDYEDLSLEDYPNIHFVGDALSARGITVSGAQGIYVAESILEETEDPYPEFFESALFI